MSRIFEALQQSESERAGSAATPFSAVELVQAAELLNAADRRSEVTTPVSEVRELGQTRRFPVTHAVESRLVCLTHQGGLGAEKLRLLALRLKNMKETSRLKKVLVTSTMPEEGKSLISANLAITLARSRHLKILLLECDLRRPSLAKVLAGQPLLPGLSEYLQTGVALREVIYEADPAGFFLLPAGTPPHNPLELMQSGKFQSLMEELSAHFDWILIDSPPIMPLADTSLLMKTSDGVLMVVREGISEKNPLRKAMEMVPPAQMLGVVLNSSSNSDSKRYYQRYAASHVPTIELDTESKSKTEASQ